MPYPAGRGLIAALIRSGALRMDGTAHLERLREASILEASLDNVRFIPCASRPHAGHPPHEAHFHMRCPCGGVIPVCAERRQQLMLSDGMHCNTAQCRCNEYHRFASLTWTTI